MKKLVGLILLFAPFALFSQQESDKSEKTSKPKPHKSIGIGIKAGFDFSNITNASMVNASSRTGYHFGLLIGGGNAHLLGSRTEIIYSRRGYNYHDSGSAGSINLDYIGLAQLMVINITKYVQIQIGGQTSYLLSVKADSSQPSTGSASADKALSFYNRLDYGFGGGVEIHPFMGLLVGARYNISLNNLYKQPTSFSSSGGTPSFYPSSSSIDLKNNVIQVFVGYRF
jgi:hypothetical protein